MTERVVGGITTEYVLGAINTLNSSWWTVTKAKLLGKKIVSEDSGCRVTCYKWRGKMYVTDCNELQ